MTEREVLDHVIYGIPTDAHLRVFIHLLDDPLWQDIYFLEMETRALEYGTEMDIEKA